jgi:hypothetical protein
MGHGDHTVYLFYVHQILVPLRSALGHRLDLALTERARLHDPPVIRAEAQQSCAARVSWLSPFDFDDFILRQRFHVFC